MLRFLKISTPYKDFIAQAYAAAPEKADSSYDEQLKWLLAWRFSYSDFWKQHLESTGLYTCGEIIANAFPLQKRWASDHGIDADPATPEGWQRIVAAQVREFKPDVLFLHIGFGGTPEFRRELKALVPSLRAIIAYDGVADDSPSKFEGCDIVLSCLESSVTCYQNAGFRSRLIKNAFEPTMAALAEGQLRDVPLSFVGAVTFGRNRHGERAKFLAQLARRIPKVEYRLRIPDTMAYLRGIGRELLLDRQFGPAWDLVKQWPDYRRLRRVSKQTVWGRDMYRELSRAQMSLNIHIDAAGNTAANLRLFEATGMGACLVTDWKPNISRLFEEDREIVTFRCVEECCEKVRYLIDHPREREVIAARGQARCLRDHRLDNEIRDIGQWIFDELVSGRRRGEN